MLKKRLLALSLAFVLVLPMATAQGWSNGPSYGEGFGTHDWVVARAAQIATARGVTWLDVNAAMAASDDPDTVNHDTYYHVYDVWGSAYGNSPARCAECFNNAVNALRAGDSATASYWVGMLSHYYSDTCNPIHTDQSTDEESMHSQYENAVDDQTTSVSSLPGWVVDDGYTFITDAAAATKNAAEVAHADYAALVGNYLAGGYPAVEGITQAHLNQAANGVADLIRSVQDVAYPFVTAPNAVYRFYNNGNGTHFYTVSVDEALSVRTKLSNIYTYEGIAYFANPATNSVPLYRFYNTRTGTHLYTADENEKNNILANLSGTYSLDGIAYCVSMSGGMQVHRFYSPAKGVHFYSADPNEIASVKANLANVWQYEGPAYCVAQ